MPAFGYHTWAECSGKHVTVKKHLKELYGGLTCTTEDWEGDIEKQASTG